MVDSSQLIDVATLALGISSSAVAVILGIWLTQFFKARDEQTKVKALMAAYLNSIYEEFPGVLSLLSYFAEPREWTEERVKRIPAIIKTIRPSDKTAQPLDTSIFQKKIQETFLKVDYKLAIDIIQFDRFVYTINFNTTRLISYLTDPPLMKPEDTKASVIGNFLSKNSQFFEGLEQLGEMLAAQTLSFQTALLKKQKVALDWTELSLKNQSVADSFKG